MWSFVIDFFHFGAITYSRFIHVVICIRAWFLFVTKWHYPYNFLAAKITLLKFLIRKSLDRQWVWFLVFFFFREKGSYQSMVYWCLCYSFPSKSLRKDNWLIELSAYSKSSCDSWNLRRFCKAVHCGPGKYFSPKCGILFWKESSSQP